MIALRAAGHECALTQVPVTYSPAIGLSYPHPTHGVAMNEEEFNLSLRKFLKMVGVSSQREIEQAVAKAIESGSIAGSENFPAHMTLEIPGLKLRVQFDGEIRLQ
jgi:hypothetical protein